MFIPSLLLLLSSISSLPSESVVSGKNFSESEEIMENQHRALTLTSQENGKMTEIIVTAQTDNPVQVSYKLAVAGDSSTRHSGSTRLSPGTDQVLSRVRIARAERWCATLDVKQGDGLAYRLTNGPC